MALDRNLWGPHYFTERGWREQLTNAAGHMAAGFALAGVACGVLVPLAGAPEGSTVILAAAGGVTREVLQYVDSRKPHLLDRARDVAEWSIGGVIGWAVFCRLL